MWQAPLAEEDSRSPPANPPFPTSSTSSHLKQIGIALHNCHAAHGCFPQSAGYFSGDDKTRASYPPPAGQLSTEPPTRTTSRTPATPTCRSLTNAAARSRSTPSHFTTSSTTARTTPSSVSRSTASRSATSWTCTAPPWSRPARSTWAWSNRPIKRSAFGSRRRGRIPRPNRPAPTSAWTAWCWAIPDRKPESVATTATSRCRLPSGLA